MLIPVLRNSWVLHAVYRLVSDGELGPEASQTRVRSSSPNEGGDNSQANLAGEPEGNRFRTQEGGAIASPSRGYLGLGRDVGRRDAIKPSEDPEIDEVGGGCRRGGSRGSK